MLVKALIATKPTQAPCTGGLEKLGALWFECGWIAVVSKNGELGQNSELTFAECTS